MQKTYTENQYEKWMWIELIGFDNQLADFGVKTFIDNTGFTPEVISLLLFNPDFVHMHDGTNLDGIFPNNFCSYGGHERNEERVRQPWTQRQLRQLIKELQKYEIKVYVSFFDIMQGSKWVNEHPELRYITKDGEPLGCLCPWKRLADKSYYEDFFAEKLVAVMKDYGFDGLHGGDGYNQPRIPISLGDFSDDMFEQFISNAPVKIPSEIKMHCDGDAASTCKRADWIWNSNRMAYIKFCTDRHQKFWRKVVTAMHEQKKPVVINSAWTRDPFEAIYRYGTDYKKLVAAGVDGFIIEAASVALETLEQSKEPLRYLCDFMASNLLNKIYVADVPLRWLHGIKDTEENWNALRQAPTALECEIHCMSNLYRWNSAGELIRCISGLMTCLSDGIAKEDWLRLKNSWDLGFSTKPDEIAGVTLIWSDNALQAQLEDYAKTRRWHVQQFLRHFIAMGAQIQSIANIDDIEKIHGSIVCINFHLWSANERAKISEYSNGSAIIIGEKDALPPQPVLMLAENSSPISLTCGVYGQPFDAETPITIKPDCIQSVPDITKLSEPQSWLDDLFFTDVSESFLAACVKTINKCVTGPKIININSGHADKTIENPKTVAITTFVIGRNLLRLMIRNDNYICVTSKIDVGGKNAKIKWLNPFTATQIKLDGSTFKIKVPGRGIAIIDVESCSDTSAHLSLAVRYK